MVRALNIHMSTDAAPEGKKWELQQMICYSTLMRNIYIKTRDNISNRWLIDC